MSSSTSSSALPSGLAVLTTFPDVLFIPEIRNCIEHGHIGIFMGLAHMIFGGLVWILVASSKVLLPMLQGWVMFVSVFCFVMSFSLLCLYFCGAHGGGGSWVTLDLICHDVAALFYLSAAVLEAFATYNFGLANPLLGQEYRENIAAVVFAFVATLLYVIHKVFSMLRWKSS